MIMFFKIFKIKVPRYTIFNLRSASSLVPEDGSQEFKVQVPWGHIAGKEWGPPNGYKLLAVHGWQDNAGSFDTLAPLLDPSLHIYAIDLPGHGKSSPIPSGISDMMGEKLSAIHRVVRHYGWKNFIYLGHSMGAAIGYFYSSTFPELVSHFIALDNLAPAVFPLEKSLKRTRDAIEGLIDLDKKIDSEPPSYALEVALSKLVEGSSGSITYESAKVLAKRGLIQHPKGGFYFSRDLKVKIPSIHYGITRENLYFYADKIKCPILFIRSKEGEKGGIPLPYFEKYIEALKNRPAPFVFETVDGTHHVHLNNPERVATIINRFCKISSSL